MLFVVTIDYLDSVASILVLNLDSVAESHACTSDISMGPVRTFTYAVLPPVEQLRALRPFDSLFLHYLVRVE